MGKTKGKGEKDTPTPEVPVAQTAPAQVWTFGVNALCPDVSEQVVKSFIPTQHFRVDFSALCELAGVVPVAGLTAPKKPVPEGAVCSTLALQSTIMDLANMRVMRHVLRAGTQLETLRLSSCCLDREMLQLLRTGLADNQCTVHTLHIDWNPVDLGLDALPAPSEGFLDALDDQERKRLQKQADRELRVLGAQLAACAGGNLSKALQEVALLANPNHRATATLTPLNLRSFVAALQAKLGSTTEDLERAFRILDSPRHGAGDGMVPLARMQEVVSGLNTPTRDEELKDPTGLAFAALIDGTSVLEVVSFRYCSLSSTEAQVIAKTMQQSQHLRALNLWGNKICDRGAAALAVACEQYFGLQYLGLGQNFITHDGLASICKVLGVHRIDAKEQADPLLKQIKDQTKDRERKLARSPPVPKKDSSGRDRYMSEFYHVDSCEERRDPVSGQAFWAWTRNITLTTLVLEHNPIVDAEVVKQLQPNGVGDLVLRGTPCAQTLLRAKSENVDQAEQEQLDMSRASAPDSAGDVEQAEPAVSRASGTFVPPTLVLSPTGGWRLVLQ